MKKMLIVLAMATFVATGVFAQLTFGITGLQYYQEDENGDLPSISDAWKDFEDGNSVYYGGFVEVIGRKLGLGLSFNYAPDQMNAYSMTPEYDLMSYDVNLYLSYHLFGGRSFLDPFLQAGIGMMGWDYMNKDDLEDLIGGENVDDNDPLMASAYWDVGFGLGVNLGPVGIFAKAMFNREIKDAVKGEYDNDFYDPLLAGKEYDIPAYGTMPFKWVFGAKILL